MKKMIKKLEKYRVLIGPKKRCSCGYHIQFEYQGFQKNQATQAFE